MGNSQAFSWYTRVLSNNYVFFRWIDAHEKDLEDIVRMHQPEEGEGTTPDKATPGSGKGKGKGKNRTKKAE